MTHDRKHFLNLEFPEIKPVPDIFQSICYYYIFVGIKTTGVSAHRFAIQFRLVPVFFSS